VRRSRRRADAATTTTYDVASSGVMKKHLPSFCTRLHTMCDINMSVETSTRHTPLTFRRVFSVSAHRERDKPGRRHFAALSLPRERPFDAEWCKMVLKTEVCRFSGLKIYPGHGMRLTKMDSQTYLFLSAKCKRLFNLRLRPAKLAWTTQYRKAHKKVRTRRTMRLRRARCALSRDVDVVSRVDARRRTARPLGKSHRSRVLGFFGHSARTGLGRHARDISSHAASPSADRRGYRRARAPVRRYPHDATPRRRRLRLARGTENRFRAGSPRRRCHRSPATSALVSACKRRTTFLAVRKKKRATTLNATLTRSNLPS